MTALSSSDVARAYAQLAVLPFAPQLDEGRLAALLAVYRQAGVSALELREAALWAASTQPQWPAPSVLLERIRSSSSGAPRETAEEAWGQVVRAMQSGWHGQGLPESLSERAQAAFASACGPSWSAFWSSARSEDMVAHRARFVSAYQSGASLDRQLLAHERRKRQEVLPQLLGLAAPPKLPYDPRREELK